MYKHANEDDDAYVKKTPTQLGLSEAQFYSLYDWALNPVLTYSDLIQHLEEELDRYHQLDIDWQREESQINMYLFAAAIACITDDYIAKPPRKLERISKIIPILKKPVEMTQRVMNSVYVHTREILIRKVIHWRKRWDLVMHTICQSLVVGSTLGEAEIKQLKQLLSELDSNNLPNQLTKRRMVLPEGYRCQDLSHYDLLEMIQQEMANKNKNHRFLIIGPRTFGAYFVPIVKEYLQTQGFADPMCMTVRPKWGVFGEERKQLSHFAALADHAIVVDDYPNTGSTFIKMIELLGSVGIHPSQISILAPKHSVNMLNEVNEYRGFILQPDALYKEQFLSSSEFTNVLKSYYQQQGWTDIVIEPDSEVDEINSKLRDHYLDEFRVRVKRVIQIKLSNNQSSCTKRIIAKSVGWGWIGYHAFLVGTRLSNFVPHVIGLRNGLLISEWVEKHQEPLKVDISDPLINGLASYVALRQHVLTLSEDPWFTSPNYRSTSWEYLLQIFQRVVNPIVSVMLFPLIKTQFKYFKAPSPTLTDGNMSTEDWIKTTNSWLKVDYEQHNFGGAELDIVDPAYDIAGAIFEFKLSPQEENAFIAKYIELTGDTEVTRRLMMYKMMYGLIGLNQPSYWIPRINNHHKKELMNSRANWARDFLNYQMNAFVADHFHSIQPIQHSGHYFFLDIDGVLDTYQLGFAHTTYSGINAIRLLQAYGFNVFVNSARSLEHVVNYCNSYCLTGGLAEYGSVLVDNQQHTISPLLDPESIKQLNACREALKSVPGIFLDDANQFSIRAYRYEGSGTMPIEPGTMDQLLREHQLNKLTYISREYDTYILQKGLNKGTGLLAVKKHFHHKNELVFAMGDTVDDVPLLLLADKAYVPANGKKELMGFIKKYNWQLMHEATQKALLAAVQTSIKYSLDVTSMSFESIQPDDPASLVIFLFLLADLPFFKKIIFTLRWVFLRK